MAHEPVHRKEDVPDPYFVYDMNPDEGYFSIKLYHGGEFHNNSLMEYIGGGVDYFDFCQVDWFSLNELNRMVKELGLGGIILYLYKVPDMDLDNGLCPLQCDNDVISFIKLAEKNHIMEIYIDKSPSMEMFTQRIHGFRHDNIKEVDGENQNIEDRIRMNLKNLVVVPVGYKRTTSVKIGHVDSVTVDLEEKQIEDTGFEYDSNNSVSDDEDGDVFNKDFCNDDDLTGVVPSNGTTGRENEDVVEDIDRENSGEGSDATHNEGYKEDDSGTGFFDSNGNEWSNICYVTQNSDKNEGDPKIILNDKVGEEDLESIDSSDEDGVNSTVICRDFNPEKEMADPQFELGLVFKDSKQFKEAIRSHSIRHKRPVKYSTNEKHRVRAKCRYPCKWFVYASWEKESITNNLVLKSMNGKHENCNTAWKNKLVTSTYLAERFESTIRETPNIGLKDFRRVINDTIGIGVSKSQANRAKRIAKTKIEGHHIEQYARIWDYSEELIRTHPGSTIVVKYDEMLTIGDTARFLRIYICLAPLREGLNKGCRRLIGLDGCHIKGRCPGQILTAVAVDANNGFWPIAWAVVEKENKETWKWFLNLLIEELNIVNDFSYSFISDQQKGLESALKELLPNSEHRFCVQHIYRNYKKVHRGKQLKDFLWSMARASNEELYNRVIEELQEFNMSAYEWLVSHAQPRHWCQAFFKDVYKCDMLCNNLSESFNSFILNERDKPIISLLEGIRIKVMDRIRDRKVAMSKNPGPNCPAIRKKVEEIVLRSRSCQPSWNGDVGYQVKDMSISGAQFVVDMRKNECSCRLWQLSGIPCKHAIACIHSMEKDPHDFLDPCYSLDKFMETYNNVLYPINGPSQWRRVNKIRLVAPIPQIQPGRPKKSRNRDVDERRSNGMKLKKKVAMHCSNCGSSSHNLRTCKEERQIQKNDGKKSVRGRGRGNVGEPSVKGRGKGTGTGRGVSLSQPNSVVGVGERQDGASGKGRGVQISQPNLSVNEESFVERQNERDCIRGRGRGRGTSRGKGNSQSTNGEKNIGQVRGGETSSQQDNGEGSITGKRASKRSASHNLNAYMYDWRGDYEWGERNANKGPGKKRKKRAD